MKSKTAPIIGLATLFLLSLAATSFAGQGIPGNQPHIGTEAGIDIVASDKALKAAVNYDYDANRLAQVGTEAGIDVQATQKAIAAAANYNYNPELLAQVGTEAGYDQYGQSFGTGRHTGASEQNIADKNSKDKSTGCRC